MRRGDLLLFLSLFALLPLVGCDKDEAKMSQASKGKLLLHQQEILYDLRGGGTNALLLNETQVLYNPTDTAVAVTLTKHLTVAEHKGLDLEEWFGLMSNLLPAETPIVPGKCRLLGPAEVRRVEGGAADLVWQAAIKPQEGVTLRFNVPWLSGEAVPGENRLVLPLIRIGATSELTGDRLRLVYTLQSKAAAPLKDVRFTLFLPRQGGTAAEPVDLCRFSSWLTRPEAQINEDVLMADGSLQVVRGTNLQFSLLNLEPGEETTVTVSSKVVKTGAHGTIVPYGQILFNCGARLAPPVEVALASGQKAEVTLSPPVYISNVGYPDVVKLVF